MRVERKIQRDKSREGQRTERKDKETDRKFAAEVRDMLQASWKNTPTLGDASTEAERLTAVLCFLRTELVEFMRTQSHFAGTRGGFVHRDRVAMEAYLMLNDIVRCRRHPIHRFFDGIKEQMGERRPATHDVYLNSALIACVKALQEIDRKINESEAIRIMLRHPGLGPYTPDLPTMRSRINKSETGSASDEYAELIQHYKNQMLNDLPITREKILSCAFNIASLIGHPLSMEAATTILDYSLVVRDENGTKLIRPPERAPLLVTTETEEGSGGDPSTA